jgi:hypothetical protein
MSVSHSNRRPLSALLVAVAIGGGVTSSALAGDQPVPAPGAPSPTLGYTGLARDLFCVRTPPPPRSDCFRRAIGGRRT